MTDIISFIKHSLTTLTQLMQSVLAQITERTEIGPYFEEFPLFRAAVQIGLIKEGKTGSFKVTSIINWSAQPKGLRGQGSMRKPLCFVFTHQVHSVLRYCCFRKESDSVEENFVFFLYLWP